MHIFFSCEQKRIKEMPTTRRRRQKQNVLFYFANGNSLLLQIDEGDLECFLQRLHPVCNTKVVYLPESFSPMAKFLAHKPNGQTYFQNVIKKALVEFCSNYPAGYDNLATNQFPTHRSVVDWCVNVVVDHYVAETSTLMPRRSSKARYLSFCNDAKVRWSQRRNARLQEEAYIGNIEFYWELNRSGAEFKEELKKVIGCTPFSWHSVM